MAMVHLSERPTSWIPSTRDQELPQVQNENYISHMRKATKTIEDDNEKLKLRALNHPAFNSICPRGDSKRSDNIPGPGSYENLNSIRPKPSASYLLKYDFISKEPRFFNPSESSELDLPGPGSYNIQENIFKRNTSGNRNINLRKTKPSSAVSNNKNRANSISSVSTIPSKEHLYGYKYGNDGSLKAVEDPDSKEKYSGTLNDSVGPAYYNVQFKSGNNNIVNWGKMSSKKLNERELNYSINEISTIENVSSIDNMNLNNVSNGGLSNNLNPHFRNSSDIMTKVDCTNLRIKNALAGRRSFNKKEIYERIVKKNRQRYQSCFEANSLLNKENNTTLKNNNTTNETSQCNLSKSNANSSVSVFDPNFQIDPNLSKKINYILNYNKLRFNPRAEKFQNFGSSTPRFSSYREKEKERENEHLGPGCYFPDRSEISKKYKILNKSASTGTLITADKKDLGYKPLNKNNGSQLGPGQYHIETSLIKKNFSKFSEFGTSEKRFPLSVENKELLHHPGPGTYHLKDQFKVEVKKKEDSDLLLLHSIIKSKNNNDMRARNKCKGPDFYSYQPPSSINNIQTNVLYKNRFNNFYLEKFAPFNSQEMRFKEKEGNENLGPGCYYGNILKGSKDKNYVPFNSKCDKFDTYKNKGATTLGPGEYDRETYFDWNKKSFNLLFV